MRKAHQKKPARGKENKVKNKEKSDIGPDSPAALLRTFLVKAELGAPYSLLRRVSFIPLEWRNRMDITAYMPYIDVADCLNRIRGNKKLFAMMLKSFKANPIFPSAYAAAQGGDRASAQMQMHTLKGVAGNLSLKRLYETVVPVEAVLKTQMPDIKDFIPVQEAFEKTLALIDGLLCELSAEGAV